MNIDDSQLMEVKTTYGSALVAKEGNVDLILIEKLAMPAECLPVIADVLLCPAPRDGYESRLYFSEKIKGPVQKNWNGNNVRILERNWYAFSWKFPHPSTLRLVQAIQSHLVGLLLNQ